MQIDFPQLFRDYGIEYSQDTPGWTNVNCPYHDNGDRGFKGGFNNSSGYYNCWNCGNTKLETILSDILSLEYYEIKNILNQYTNEVSIIKKLNKKESVSKIELPIETLNNRCKRYLISRNYDPDYLHEKYKIAGMTLVGNWAGRLIIPIFYNSKLISWQGRSLYSKQKCKELNILRYKTLNKNQSVIDPKSVLYNIDNCKNDYLILVEGSFDCWRIGDNCAATLGTSYTPEQKSLMIKYKRIIILFDPEKEAQERAIKLGKELNILGMNNVEIIDNELGHDPGDMSDKEVLKLKRRLRI